MPLPTRRVAAVALVALLAAGGGTWLAVRAQGDAAAARTAAGLQRAAAPVLAKLPAPVKAVPAKVGMIAEHVGPAGLKRIKTTIDAHAPSRAVQQASRAVLGAGGGATAASKPAKGRARAAATGEYERRAFGRGAILRRRR